MIRFIIIITLFWYYHCPNDVVVIFVDSWTILYPPPNAIIMIHQHISHLALSSLSSSSSIRYAQQRSRLEHQQQKKVKQHRPQTLTFIMTRLFQSNNDNLVEVGQKIIATSTISRNDNQSKDNYYNNMTTLIIPIFPLRKKVRLPTEILKLNLYEQRYIQMARYIKQMQQGRHEKNNITDHPSPAMFFGAIYCSNKPQIVSNGGIGPIVPIIENGDIGILYLVQEYQDGVSVIRMTGQGMIRFQVINIISNGIIDNNNEQMNADCNIKKLPFILANVKIVLDDDDDDDDYNENSNSKNNNNVNNTLEKFWNDSKYRNNIQESLLSNNQSPLSLFTSFPFLSSLWNKKEMTTITKRSHSKNSSNEDNENNSNDTDYITFEQIQILMQQMNLIFDMDDNMKLVLQNEMSSFALASSVLSHDDVSKRWNTLTNFNTTKQRIQYLSRYM